MAVNYDIAIQDNDLVFADGDLFIAESDQQHIIDTMNAFPGWWKENPADGVGLMAFNKAPASLQELARSIKVNLQSDGYNVENPIVTLSPDGSLFIDPKATKK